MPRPRDWAAFGLAAATAWVGLGSYGLVEPSDARYAEIAREMWATGDFFFPKLLGIHHFHKAPLIYWLTDLGYALFGPNEWGARACLGALGLVLAVTVWRFARRHLSPESAPWAVLLLSTTPALIGAGRMLTTDLLMATCFVLALTCWYGVWSGVGGVGDLICFYAATGLTFLTKGPVASLLLLLIVAPFTLLHRGRGARRTESWGMAWGIPLILALALPWYLYAVLKNPGLLHYFVGGQLASRLGSGGMGHPHSWMYYIAVFPALGLPWILLAPRGWQTLRQVASPLATFLALWALVPPLVFSLPATKLPLYVLPAYPALALLAARCLAPQAEGATPALRFAAWLFLVLGAALAVVGLGAVPLGRGDLAAVPLESARVLFLPLGLICLAGGACALGWARERPVHAALALVFAVALLPLWAFTKGDLLPIHTVKIVGRAAAAELQPGDTLAEYRDLSSGLPFYAGSMPLLAGIRRETQFESGKISERVISREEFRDLWSGHGRVLAVTRLRHADDLAGARELARGGGYVLLANH